MLLRTIFEAQMAFEPSSSEANNKLRFEVEMFNYNVTLDLLKQIKHSDIEYGTDIKRAEQHLQILKSLMVEAQTQRFGHASELQQQYTGAIEAAKKIWREGEYSAYSYLHNRPHVWPDDASVGGTVSGIVLVPEWGKNPPPPPKQYTVFIHSRVGSHKITRLFEGSPEFTINGIIPGEYTVFVQAQDYKALSSAKPVTVQAGQEVKIRFSMEYDPPASGLKTRVMPKW